MEGIFFFTKTKLFCSIDTTKYTGGKSFKFDEAENDGGGYLKKNFTTYIYRSPRISDKSQVRNGLSH